MSKPCLYGSVFHVFRSHRGPFKIDVNGILAMSYRRRWWMLRDRDYPYVLRVEYEDVSSSFVWVGRLVFIGTSARCSGTSSRCFENDADSSALRMRYRTEMEVLGEIGAVNEKKWRASGADKLRALILDETTLLPKA